MSKLLKGPILGIVIALLAASGIAKCSYDNWREDVEEERKEKEQAEEQRAEKLRAEIECEKSKNWFFCTADESRQWIFLRQRMEIICPAVSLDGDEDILTALECRNAFLSAYHKYQQLNKEWNWLLMSAMGNADAD